MAEELAIDSKALIFATLADVYLSSGMADEAISILKDGLSRNPTYTLGKIILGRAYYIKGDIKTALKILEDIYEEAKTSESENLYLARCYKKLSEFDKAIKYYESVLKINPQNNEAKQELDIIIPRPAAVEEKIEEIKEVTVKPPGVVGEKEDVVIAVPIMEAPKIEREVEAEKITTGKEPIEEIQILPEIGFEPTFKEPTPVSISPFEKLTIPVNRLLNLKAVKGVFICSKDGLLIQNYYEAREDIEEISALIAEIYNEANEAFRFLKEGTLEKCIIEKVNETICVIPVGDSLLCIITKPEAKPGLVFVYARKIIDEIREILG